MRNRSFWKLEKKDAETNGEFPPKSDGKYRERAL